MQRGQSHRPRKGACLSQTPLWGSRVRTHTLCGGAPWLRGPRSYVVHAGFQAPSHATRHPNSGARLTLDCHFFLSLIGFPIVEILQNVESKKYRKSERKLLTIVPAHPVCVDNYYWCSSLPFFTVLTISFVSQPPCLLI